MIAAAALAGCGFEPAYGPSGAGRALFGKVAIEPPENRNGYALADRLRSTLGPADAARYSLSYEISTAEDAIGFTRDQEITRYHVTGRVRFALFDLEENRIVVSDEVSSFTSYSATGTTVSSLTATRDAYDRLMSLLADRIVTMLLAKTGAGA